MDITYEVNQAITPDEFIAILKSSGLADRRPVNDYACMEGMIKNSNLIVTAWHGDKLVGIARSITDFHYVCYLSDLAVDKTYQKRNVGKNLQSLTQKQLGPRCKVILIAAPAANAYYRHIGFTNNDRCWVLERSAKISS